MSEITPVVSEAEMLWLNKEIAHWIGVAAKKEDEIERLENQKEKTFQQIDNLKVLLIRAADALELQSQQSSTTLCNFSNLTDELRKAAQ